MKKITFRDFIPIQLKTRIKTSISSEALTQFGTEKIVFPLKPDRWTDRH